mgnify:CR=1 FL=1
MRQASFFVFSAILASAIRCSPNSVSGAPSSPADEQGQRGDPAGGEKRAAGDEEDRPEAQDGDERQKERRAQAEQQNAQSAFPGPVDALAAAQQTFGVPHGSRFLSHLF